MSAKNQLPLWASVLTIAFLALQSTAQIVYREGRPPSWSMPNVTSAASASVLPAFNVDSIRRDDVIRDRRKNKPFRFAVPHVVDMNPGNSGYWTSLPNGDRIWRVEFRSPGARTLNVIFNRFQLAEGAELYLYNSDRSQVLGPFTHRNELPGGSLATAPVDGDALVVEYLEPRAAAGSGKLSIGQVAHGYRGLNSEGADFGESGSCNNNTVCPEWNAWRCQIKSEVLLLQGGSSFCTGTLLNNTAQDGTPIVLTANHCTEGSVTNWVFLFNWESPSCTPTANASRSQTVSGAKLLVKNSRTDFSLVQMSSKPPANYNAYYTGWDATGEMPKSQVGIHHPSTDIKKISLDRNPATRSANFWDVAWDDGTTEPGSSGSGLWNNEGRIIGQLLGGDASCSETRGNDEYGRLDISWGLGASTFLDPGKTGLKKIDGLGTGACAGNAVVAAFRVGGETVCNGSVAFTDQSLNAKNWIWNFGDGEASTQRNPSHTYAATGSYTVTLTVTGDSNRTDTSSTPVQVTRMEALLATGDSVCMGTPALLKASAGNGTLINWYASPNGGAPLGTGMTFSTPALNAPTIYYAEAVEDKPVQKVGPAGNSFGAGGYYSSSSSHGQYFTMQAGGTLKSVKVYANSAGNRTIEVLDSAITAVTSKSISIPQGESRVALDFSLSPGNYFMKMATDSPLDLYRNSAGASYPYAIPNLVSINRSSAGNGELSYYYFFYDWEVQGSGCRTGRTPVTVARKSVGCATGLADVSLDASLKVYPELNNGLVFVHPIREGEMEAVNPAGDVVLTIRLRVGINGVDLRSLRDGVYMLRFPEFPNLTRRIVIAK